jgi:hypothetical protein
MRPAVSDLGRGVRGTGERTPTRGVRHHRRMIRMQYLAAAGSKACNRRVEVRPFL